MGFHTFTQGSFVCEIIATFKGLHLIIIGPVVMHPLGEENVLNCSSEVALVFMCVRTYAFPVLPRVTGVICFPFSPTVLIDDHSLFHANTLLLSRVHYSKTLTLGKRGRLMGKHNFFMCFIQGHSRKKGPGLHYGNPITLRGAGLNLV